MRIKIGDILECEEEYLMQQCNCLTVKAHGLSQTLSDKWSWANVYTTRKSLNGRNLAIEKDRARVGSIKVCKKDIGPMDNFVKDNSKVINVDKKVICLFAQWCPGPPQRYKSYPNYEIDTFDNRAKWFSECLDKVGEYLTNKKIKVIAVPWRIGCGLARGNWVIYKDMLKKFEKKYSIECVLYKLN